MIIIKCALQSEEPNSFASKKKKVVIFKWIMMGLIIFMIVSLSSTVVVKHLSEEYYKDHLGNIIKIKLCIKTLKIITDLTIYAIFLRVMIFFITYRRSRSKLTTFGILVIIWVFFLLLL